MNRYLSEGRNVLLRSDLVRGFDDVRAVYAQADLSATALGEAVAAAQEGVFRAPWAAFAFRTGPGRCAYARIHADRLVPEEISDADFLKFKEGLISPAEAEDPLELDFGPFGRGFPRLSEARSIGQGLSFLNRHLASRLFSDGGAGAERIHRFLGLHALEGRSLLLRAPFPDTTALRAALRKGTALLAAADPETPFSAVEERLAGLGFAPGWGATAGRAAETMSLLIDLFEAPSAELLETFLARVPMISRVLVLSPHGWFGQSGVLGLPDTGGQVVYILDQVRALEREMRDRMAVQGVDVEPRIVVVTRLIPDAGATGCDQRLEPIDGCRSARHPERPVPPGRRERRAALALPLQGLALPRPLLARGRAGGGGRARRAPRPDPRQLLRRQPRRRPHRDAPRRHPCDDRPRPREDEVPPLGPPLEGDRGRLRLLGVSTRPTSSR